VQPVGLGLCKFRPGRGGALLQKGVLASMACVLVSISVVTCTGIVEVGARPLWIGVRFKTPSQVALRLNRLMMRYLEIALAVGTLDGVASVVVRIV